MNIAIFGGGISGLTVAHELINKGFKVVLYEKDSQLGGMAQSRIEKNGIPSEHSWRGYAPFYKNFFNIAQQINIGNSKTVYDNLSKPINFYQLSDKEIGQYTTNITLVDKLVVLYIGIKYSTSGARKNHYYTQPLEPILKKWMSKDGYNRLIEFASGPGFGLERDTLSIAHFFKILSITFLSTGAEHEHTHKLDNNKIYEHGAMGKWHEMIKPTNQAWFDPWEKYLKKKGVKFHYNSEITSINGKTVITKGILISTKNNIISSVIVNKKINVKADKFVLCINPFEAEKLFVKSKMKHMAKQHHLLNKNSQSNQISFRLGFNKKIKFPIKEIAFVMTDSEYNITFYPQKHYWKNVDTKNLNSLWSGTLIRSNKKGALYNKFSTDITINQLKKEIIHQILRSKDLQKLVHTHNGFKLKKEDVTYSEIWHEWKEINGKLKQTNTKWVNTIYNQKYRPTQKTEYSNLFLGGAHTKTSMDIWSMEGAVESGKLVSELITSNIIIHSHTEPIILTPIQYVDNILYYIGLPQLTDSLLLYGLYKTITYAL